MFKNILFKNSKFYFKIFIYKNFKNKNNLNLKFKNYVNHKKFYNFENCFYQLEKFYGIKKYLLLDLNQYSLKRIRF